MSLFSKPRKELNNIASKAPGVLPYGHATHDTTSFESREQHNLSSSIMRAKHCVPFRALVPCHFFLPSLVHRLVVFTVVAFSDGSKGPKSRFLTFEDVDQIQVLFHVNARCLRIQNAVLKTWNASACMRNFELQIISTNFKPQFQDLVARGMFGFL